MTQGLVAHAVPKARDGPLCPRGRSSAGLAGESACPTIGAGVCHIADHTQRPGTDRSVHAAQRRRLGTEKSVPWGSDTLGACPVKSNSGTHMLPMRAASRSLSSSDCCSSAPALSLPTPSRSNGGRNSDNFTPGSACCITASPPSPSPPCWLLPPCGLPTPAL